MWVCLAAITIPVTPAMAGPNANAKILLHLQFPTTKAACDVPGAQPPCAGLFTEGDMAPTRYFAYVLVGDGSADSGVGGAEFGIDYDGAPNSGVDIFEWHLCADHEFPSAGWPAAGSGNRVTWDTGPGGHCQLSVPGGYGTSVVATVGYFYCAAYSPDRLRVVANSASQAADVTDCGGMTDHLYDPATCNPTHALGSAGFGGEAGYNPCEPWTVVERDCGAIGPSSVMAGATGVVYGDPYALACSYQVWSVTGNAVIVGDAHENLVTLNVGAAGQFKLSHSCTWDVDAGSFCCKLVQVLDPVAVQPATWSRIKAMYH